MNYLPFVFRSSKGVLPRFLYHATKPRLCICTKDIKFLQTQIIHEKEGLYTRLRNKSALYIAKQKLKRSGFYLLEAIVDHTDYPEFFKTLNLTDSFYSWFAVTELHLWMLVVRLMAEGEEGRHVRNLIVQALWSDVKQRVKKLGVTSAQNEISELAEQLNAAFIAYDEGLLTNDTILAGALWRRLYQQDPLVNLENLDVLVKYVRRQMKLLDAMTKNELFQDMKIKWEPLKT